MICGRSLLAVVLLVHTGYQVAPVELHGAVFSVLRGIEGALLFWLLSRSATGLALIACWLGLIEEAQTAACGAIVYDLPVPFMSGLCLEWLGRWPYLIAAAASLAYLHRERINAVLARIYKP